MPSGIALRTSSNSASPGTPSIQERDALDGTIGQTLRQRPAAASAPPHNFNDETLLRYLDGSLDTQTHAQVEQFLLHSPQHRGQIADIKKATREAAPSGGQPPVGSPAGTARLVLCWLGESLTFLRGSCEATDDEGQFFYRFPLADALFQLSPAPQHTVNLTVTVQRAAAPEVTEVILDRARLLAGRHELRLHSHGDALGTLVLDLRRA